MTRIPPLFRRLPPCSASNLTITEGNSNTSMNTRTQPYYFRRCKKRVRSTNIESLPDDLLCLILVRLPADHLCDRARVVCRRWYHIIHSYAFVTTQIQHSAYGLLLSSRLDDGVCPIFVSATQGRVESSEFTYTCKTRILGSCDGLALELDLYDSEFPHIINPATKQTFHLPSFRSIEGRLVSVVYENLCAIAYAAASNEYKVALSFVEILKSPNPFLAILTVGVANSWRRVRIEHLSEDDRSFFERFPLSTEGFMHWVRGTTQVLTLNVETEILTMSKVPLPQTCYRRNSRIYYLPTGKYLSRVVAREDFLWEVLIMKPETREWTKLPDIKLGAQKCRLEEFACGQRDVLMPIGWVRFPEVLALHFSGESLTCIFYNLDTHEINSIELPSSYACSRGAVRIASYIAVVHKNNLMWLSKNYF